MERRSGRTGTFFGCSKYGTVDVMQQCLGTLPWRALPRAAELRDGAR
jgi:hypothetical protein